MAGEGEPLSVLVVDDDEQYATLASRQLDRSEPSIEARHVTDPRAAIREASNGGVDCVLADYVLPGMDGIELAESLQELRDDLPIVLLTGEGSEAVAGEALRSGVSDYLRKGEDDDPAELANCVRRAVEGRRDDDRMRTFVRMASHDLRNPLAVARGWLDVYHDSGDETAYERAHDALVRMEEILDDVEALARAEDDAAVARQAVDLSSVATAAWEIVDPGDAELEAEYGRRVEADPSLLQALLENLFDNAVTHAGPGVTVRVGVLSDGDGFFVEDDGPGIPPGERDRVFERGHSSDGGTGLGLAIVDCIADAHGWTVELAGGGGIPGTGSGGAVAEQAGGARFEFRDVSLVESG